MNKIYKGILSILKKISDGFFEHAGAALAITIATFAGSYFGGRAANNEIKTELAKRDTVFVVNPISDFNQARQFEADGFQALLERDYEKATQSFIASENRANSYHSSYEIGHYLDNKRNDVSNPDFWTEVYKYLLKNHYGFMPPEVKAGMEEYLRDKE